MPLVTCPDCQNQVSDQATSCPHCGRPLSPQPAPMVPLAHPTQPKKTSRATWGCLVLVALGVVAFLIEKSSTSEPQNHLAASQPEWRTNQKTGQRYIAMPSYSVSGAIETKPWLHVRVLLGVGSSRIKSELLKQLGPTSNPVFDKGSTSWKAKTPEGSVWVVGFKGKIASIQIDFTPAVRDWGAALAAIDLQPCTTPPTADGIGGLTWTNAFEGIDEVDAVHKTEGKPPVGVITVIPDKTLADEAGRS